MAKSGVSKKIAKKAYSNVKKDLVSLESHMNSLVEHVQKMNESAWYGSEPANKWYTTMQSHYSTNKKGNLVIFYSGVADFQSCLHSMFTKSSAKGIDFGGGSSTSSSSKSSTTSSSSKSSTTSSSNRTNNTTSTTTNTSQTSSSNQQSNKRNTTVSNKTIIKTRERPTTDLDREVAKAKNNYGTINSTTKPGQTSKIKQKYADLNRMFGL